MAYDIRTEELSPQLVLSLTAEVDPSNVGAVIGAGIGEVCGHIASCGARVCGEPMVVYPEPFEDGRQSRIEICVPVAGEVTETDRLLLAELPPLRVVSTVHRGTYATIGAAYQALGDWVLDNGRETAGAPRETYLNDPAQVSESELLTRVDWPID